MGCNCQAAKSSIRAELLRTGEQSHSPVPPVSVDWLPACAGQRKPLAETSPCKRSRRHAFGWFEHLQRTFTSFITRKSNLLMTDALDSLGACPIAPEAAVSEADSERPAFPRRTRFFRSVPSERDLESREASESGSPERTYRPHVHRIYDDLAPLRSL